MRLTEFGLQARVPCVAAPQGCMTLALLLMTLPLLLQHTVWQDKQGWRCLAGLPLL